MADDDQIHDEYQLADLDGIETEPQDTVQNATDGNAFPEKKPMAYSVNTRRNAIIAVSVFIFSIVSYKFFSSHSAQKKPLAMENLASNTKPSASTMTPVQPKFAEQPIQQVNVPIVSNTQVAPMSQDGKISQKLSALEMSQQSMRDDFTTINSQLSGMNSNINEIMTKMAEVTRVVSNLSAIAEAQSHEIGRMAKASAKRMQAQQPRLAVAPPVKYYIQAVIPGRAWLIATNGNSITVRAGSVVSGYGVVKLIDAVQGRVMTSSGQTIRFSQSDS